MKAIFLLSNLFIISMVNSSRVLTKNGKEDSDTNSPKPSLCLDTKKFEDYVKKTFKKEWSELVKGMTETTTNVFFLAEKELVLFVKNFTPDSQSNAEEYVKRLQKVLAQTKGDKHHHEYL